MRLPLILVLALVVFLALGAFAERRMAATAHEMNALLRQVEQLLENGRAKPALTMLRRMERLWGKAETTWAMITDHHEIDQVYLAIDRADKLITFGSIPEAQAEIASLRFLVDHIPKKESFGLKSVI